MEAETDFIEVGFPSLSGPVKAIFSSSFAKHLEQWKWGVKALSGKLYIYRGTSTWAHGKSIGRTVFAHRVVMGCTHGDGQIVDHINGNTLDNRIENLRIVTAQQNNWNKGARATSGFFGVSKRTDGYVARVTHNGIIHYCGFHKTAVNAALAVDEKLIALRGEYARLNFPREN